ncbi:hypothetical protein RJ641_030202 [Dillenia turbinata]|uniref:Uncharacterized protein n=1 Tax=Dillenia turbinata TaxID=194707 RepID=A0AAN8W2S5_9MAGN
MFPGGKFILCHRSNWTDMLLEHNATVEDASRGWLVAAYAASMEKSGDEPSACILQKAYEKEAVLRCSLIQFQRLGLAASF